MPFFEFSDASRAVGRERSRSDAAESGYQTDGVGSWQSSQLPSPGGMSSSRESSKSDVRAFSAAAAAERRAVQDSATITSGNGGFAASATSIHVEESWHALLDWQLSSTSSANVALFSPEQEYVIHKAAKSLAEYIQKEEQRRVRAAMSPYGEQSKALDGVHGGGGGYAPSVVLHEPTRSGKAIKDHCEFCFNNARHKAEQETPPRVLSPMEAGPWREHRCKDARNNVVCPHLSAHQCECCGATGYKAHTIRYCPVSKAHKLQALTRRKR